MAASQHHLVRQFPPSQKSEHEVTILRMDYQNKFKYHILGFLIGTPGFHKLYKSDVKIHLL